MSGRKRKNWSKSAQANAALYSIGQGRAGSLRWVDGFEGVFGGWGWDGWRPCIYCDIFVLNRYDLVVNRNIDAASFAVLTVFFFSHSGKCRDESPTSLYALSTPVSLVRLGQCYPSISSSGYGNEYVSFVFTFGLIIQFVKPDCLMQENPRKQLCVRPEVGY